MPHTNETPQNDWYFGKNGVAPNISEILKMWPMPIYLSCAAGQVKTGNGHLPDSQPDNSIKKIYKLWENDALINGRSSWGQIVILFAIRPEYFTVERGELRQTGR